jgi:hypothetical protein
MLHLSSMSNDKEGLYRQIPPEIADSATVSLVHGLCESGGSVNNKETIKNSQFALKMIDPEVYHGLF